MTQASLVLAYAKQSLNTLVVHVNVVRSDERATREVILRQEYKSSAKSTTHDHVTGKTPASRQNAKKAKPCMSYKLDSGRASAAGSAECPRRAATYRGTQAAARPPCAAGLHVPARRRRRPQRRQQRDC
eukprot:3963217-Pleurochrysis_carterae.AAC.2